MSKPLPKSLHTVTVLVRVATLVMEKTTHTPVSAVVEALDILGYGGTSDDYGLADKAVAVLNADKRVA